jgi:hypothetical protein
MNDNPLYESKARVEGNCIYASWQFAPAEAPATFAVTITEHTDDGRERPVATRAPIQIERSDGALVEWRAKVTLEEAVEDRTFRLRASAGKPIDVGERELLRAPALPPDRVDELIDLRALLEQQSDGGRAILSRLMPSADPDQLRKDIDAEIERALDPDLRAIWPLDGLFKPVLDEAALAAFHEAYKLAAISKDEAGNQRFQTKEDWARYASTKGAVWFHLGGEVERPLSLDVANPTRDLSVDVRDGDVANGSIEMALFADNPNGLHPARAIASQIVCSGLPYAFHLGDVYYGGNETEFADYCTAPLSPMFDRTELFMITGNHEMYARGEWFNKAIRRKAKQYPERQRQRAESFRVCGPGFQIIGLDTMFVGWNSGHLRSADYADEGRLKLLDSWLSERPNDLTVLLTTNEAWDKGKKTTTRLYQSLRSTIAGRVDLWFWGNVHYASLFEPWAFADAGLPPRQMITSCIGHGGYPFYTEERVGELPAGLGCRWLETKSRFWPEKRVRPDVGLNGWCRMKLTRAAGGFEVNLTYVDWVGRDRLRAKIVREDGASVRFASVEESDIAYVGAPSTWRALAANAAK